MIDDPAARPLAGRVALVTGAGGDIGAEIAVRLASSHALVVVADLGSPEGKLEAVVARCSEAGTKSAVAAEFDVSDEGAVHAAIERIVGELGTPSIVVNCAGVQGPFAPTHLHPMEAAGVVLEVNVAGVLGVMAAASNAMITESTGGSIVNLASMAGVGAAPNMLAYSASKGAVIAATRTAAKDLGPHRIRVNAVSPAFIGPGAMWDRQVALQAETESRWFGDDPGSVAEQMIGQVALGRYGSLAEVASVVHFLASDESSYVSGVNIEVAGGPM